MPKSARRYDIFLPLNYNDGRPIEDSHFDVVERRLLEHFRGVTAQQRDFPFRGMWKDKAQLYMDQVVVMTVIDFRRGGSAAFIRKLKKNLLRDFQQLEIFITETSLKVH